MPNLDPVPDTPELVEKMCSRNQEDGVVKVKQYGSITHGLKSEELVDFDGMDLVFKLQEQCIKQ